MQTANIFSRGMLVVRLSVCDVPFRLPCEALLESASGLGIVTSESEDLKRGRRTPIIHVVSNTSRTCIHPVVRLHIAERRQSGC